MDLFLHALANVAAFGLAIILGLSFGYWLVRSWGDRWYGGGR